MPNHKAPSFMQIMFKASVVLIFAGFFSVANAAEAPPMESIRCLVVGALMVNSTDTTQRAAGTMVMVYWIGRLDSFSEQEIEDAMVRQSDMTPLQIQTERVRCGEVLRVKGEMMQQIGKNIIRRGKEMDKQKAAPANAPNDSKPIT
jgi:metal-dependent HD superfamily phosphatase/phosphodiesterase